MKFYIFVQVTTSIIVPDLYHAPLQNGEFSLHLLAQRSNTLVLMMINSCSYSLLMILCLISFKYLIKILVGVWLQQRSFGANTCRFKSLRVKIASSIRSESSLLDRVWIESTWRRSSTRRLRFVFSLAVFRSCVR